MEIHGNYTSNCFVLMEGVLQIICFAAARNLKLDMMPGVIRTHQKSTMKRGNDKNGCKFSQIFLSARYTEIL